MRTFLAAKNPKGSRTRGAAAIWTRYQRFTGDLPVLSSSLEISINEIRSFDYLSDWLAIMSDRIGLEQLMALALTDDQAEQLRVWEQASEWQRDATSLRRMLVTQEIDAQHDPVAKLIEFDAKLTQIFDADDDSVTTTRSRRSSPTPKRREKLLSSSNRRCRSTALTRTRSVERSRASGRW